MRRDNCCAAGYDDNQIRAPGHGGDGRRNRGAFVVVSAQKVEMMKTRPGSIAV
jgi:hypothetical protein